MRGSERLLFALGLSFAFTFAACSGNGSNRTDAGPDADTGSESETGTGSGSESDGGTDTLTDTGTNLDAGPDASVDASIDSDTDRWKVVPCLSDTDCADAGLVCNESWGICVAPDCASRLDFTPCKLVTEPDRSYDICSDGTCVSPGCGDASCNPPGPHFKLPPAMGHNAFQRTVDDEPVVVDTITKLMWTGCSVGLTGSDCKGGDALVANWEDSISVCEDLVYHGYSDWRLPDRFEIQSILDYGKEDPAIDTKIFPTMRGCEDNLCQAFYAISSSGSGGTNAWGAAMELGEVVAGSATLYNLEIICVRGVPTPRERYEKAELVDGEPVVEDHVTGLTWQGCPIALYGEQCDQGQLYPTADWMYAMSTYCQSQDWSGHADWRMPDIKELMSIVDDRRMDPAFSPDLFPNLSGGTLWSATGWYVYEIDGLMANSAAYYRAVLCARNS
ncbi:MAG: DUF1566 domain-containing protein [Deltaproteobacteria bacterium]|nr:DUF1566 domain-containing protein [Deltaproteobacteria bacterium]